MDRLVLRGAAALSLLVPLLGSGREAEAAMQTGRQEAIADARWLHPRNLNTPREMPRYRTLAEWQERRAWLIDHARAATGLVPMPEPRAVEATVFGRIEREGYTVEKAFFASRPGLYVTGNLYRPTTPGPHPAVACTHGHWATGRLENGELASHAARGIGLARRGMVAFVYDMMGYVDADQIPHNWDGPLGRLWGVSAAGVQTLNSVRVLDFLASLPDVDPSRLAVTGESGGGTQTFLLAAVDPRVACAVPVNMVSAHFQGGCICENPPGLRIETFNPEIAAIVAPKPQLLISCTRDWTSQTPTVEGPMVRGVYSLFGEAERLRWVQEEAEHNNNRASREHMYRFLYEAFYREADPSGGVEAPFTVEAEADLRVWSDRARPADRLDLAGLTSALVEEKRAFALGRAVGGRSEAVDPLLASAYAHALQIERPERVVVRDSRIVEVGWGKVERLVLGREGVGDAVSAILCAPRDGEPAARVLLVGGRGSDDFLAEGGEPGGLLRELLERGAEVLLVDPFGVGQAAAPEAVDRTTGIEYFDTYNRSEPAERAQDVLTAVAWLEARDGGSLSVAGLGEAGLWCALAAPWLPAEASLAIDLCGVDPDADATYTEHLPVALILQAGGLRTALAGSPCARFRAWGVSAAMRPVAATALGRLDDEGMSLNSGGDPGNARLAEWLVARS